MEARCAAEQDSSLVMGEEGCPKPSELAGWCVKEASAGSIEATSMMISGMSDCGGNKMACETFVGGAFEAASGCGGGAPPATGMGGGVPSEYANMGPPTGDNKCMIAPGKFIQFPLMKLMQHYYSLAFNRKLTQTCSTYFGFD